MSMKKKISLVLLVFLLTFSSSYLPLAVNASASQETHIHLQNSNFKSASPFSAALHTLQKQIGYDFNTVNLLRRAMTHPSYSGENNRALSILGLTVLETCVSLRSLQTNIDISPKELNARVKGVTEVDSCAVDGLRLGLEKVVRVSPKINGSTPSIVCGAYRAIFGAIAVDSGKADEAGTVFWNASHRRSSDYRAFPM